MEWRSEKHSMAKELRLHSPAGTEPAVYTWPLQHTVQYSIFIACVYVRVLYTTIACLDLSVWHLIFGVYNIIDYIFTDVFCCMELTDLCCDLDIDLLFQPCFENWNCTFDGSRPVKHEWELAFTIDIDWQSARAAELDLCTLPWHVLCSSSTTVNGILVSVWYTPCWLGPVYIVIVITYPLQFPKSWKLKFQLSLSQSRNRRFTFSCFKQWHVCYWVLWQLCQDQSRGTVVRVLDS